MNRREFVQGTLAGGALATVPAWAAMAEAASAPVEPLKISVLSYAFHGLLREGKWVLRTHWNHHYLLPKQDICLTIQDVHLT